MKFHNQRSFMGHEISNVNNKPLLRKKGKQWIVVAVSALILAGFGGMVSTTTHADTTNAQPTTTKVAQPSQNNGNSSKVTPTSNPTKNNSAVTSSNNKPVVHMLGGNNLAAQQTYQATSHGTWGTATWSIDNNGNLTISNGNLQGVNYFNGINKYGKIYCFPQSSDTNHQTGYLNEDAVKTINVQNVIAPKNASGLFSGNEGQWQNTGTYNHFNNVQSIDLSGLDTSNTTDMSSMFHGDNSLSKINLNHMNTSQVTNMQAMFDDDHNIKSLNLNSFDTSKCNTFDMMFFDMPNLQLLDIHNFVVDPNKSGFNVGGMFEFNGTNHLKELVVGPNFKLTSDYTGGSGYFDQGSPSSSGLNNSATGNNMSWYNPNSNVTVSNLSDIVSHTNNDGVWIAEPNGQTSSMTDYTVNFLDQSNGEKNVGQTKFEGMQNAPTLPINGISLPNGYRLAPNAGTTADVTSGNTADIDVLPNDASAYGTWGSSNWILYNDGKLQLTTGLLKSNDISTAATNNLQGLEGKVTSISTKNNTVTAPADSSNLFGDFPNATSVDLSGLNDINSSNINDMLSNSVRTVTLGNNSKLEGPLYAYQDTPNNGATSETDISNDKQTSGTWTIDYVGTMSAEASADAQSAENAANTSASNTFTSASSWVASNSASVSDNSNWIKNHSGSLASAYNSATSAMNSLNADSAELNWLNSSEGSISSDDSWVETHSADLNNLDRNWQSVNTRISTDEGNLNKVINTKADSSTLTSDVDTLNKDIRTASGIAAQAKQLANTNAANINTNSNTATKGISNANASASASASAANANADSYALSLANNATDTANVNAGGIDNTINDNDQTVQSLSNTVNANTESLADNEDNLYQTKADKPAKKQSIKKVNGNLFYFYVIKPMWLHTNAKFTKGNRVKALTAKHGYTLPITRIFKVNGALRFEVKINGTKYFVTGRKDFARNAYIQPNEIKRNSSIKVLRNIREYKRAGFGKKNFIRNFKRGSVLPIKRAKTIAGKQVTRLQLTNGHWITANKNLVKLI